MAKTKSVNKSQMVRDLLDKDGDMKPAAIVEALKKQGVTITASAASVAKAGWRKGAGTKKRGRKKATSKPASAAKVASTKPVATVGSETVSLVQIEQLHAIVTDFGSIEQVRSALATLESIGIK